MDEQKSKNFAMALAASQMGLMVAAGLLGGLWLDKRFGSTPLCGFIGLISGFIAGFRLLIKLVRSNKTDGSNGTP